MNKPIVPLVLSTASIAAADQKLNRLLQLVLFVIMAWVSIAVAAEKSQFTDVEMKALVGSVSSFSSMDMQGGKNYRGRVTYASDGALSGTITFTGRPPVAFTGTWKLDGHRLCRTILPLQPQEVCETWLRSGDKEVTIRVDGSDIAVNRW